MIFDFILLFTHFANIDSLVKVRNCILLSFPRKRESSDFNHFWTPAFAGVTAFGTFYETIKSGNVAIFTKRHSYIHTILAFNSASLSFGVGCKA